MEVEFLILVMGSGSVGSLFGGLVAAKKHEVILFGRKAHVDKINSDSLKIQGLINQDVKIAAFDKVEKVKQYLIESEKSLEYVLFTTKAHQTERAAKQIQDLILPEVTIVSIQNGLGPEDILKGIFSKNIVLRVVTSIGVCRPEPGVVDFTGDGKTLVGYNSLEEKIPAERLVSILKESDVNSFLEDNILGAVFSKTIVNCALNPLTAIHNVKNFEIYNQKPLREKATLLAQEAWNVAKKLNVKLTTENPIEFTFEIIKKTGENYSSMLSDIRNKRKTEIDYINGRIVTLGLEHNVEVVHNQEIYNEILSLEKSFLE